MTPKSYPFVTLDVFTEEAYAGNPLAIIFLPDPDPLRATQKQSIASEMNLTETIFIHDANPEDESKSQRRISIFTTEREIPFAGHPTIGAASWLLLQDSKGASDKKRPTSILTKAGPIPIRSFTTDGPDNVSASIPHNIHLHSTRFPLKELLRLHPSLKPHLDSKTHRGGFPIVSIVKGMTSVLIPLSSDAALEDVETAAGGEVVGCAASSAKAGYLDPGWEHPGRLAMYFYYMNEGTGLEIFRTRMIAGTLEDPATGSAAASLSTYLALQEQAEKGREREFRIIQGVEMGRRSDIGLKVLLKDGSEKGVERVELSGCAAVVLEGKIRV